MSAELSTLLQSCLKERLFIHFIGVAGSGMSALARLLLEQGYRVSGSDLKTNASVERLIEQGMVFVQNHSASALAQAGLVVYSSAIGPDNIERVIARERHLLKVRRAELLAHVAGQKESVVVAGMHGKTTCTSMLAYVLRRATRNPSYYVGAEVPILGANAAWTEGAIIVVEGDESDGTLIHFQPQHSLLLNIEAEHLDHYGSLEAIFSTFAKFIENTRGKLVYCADDPNTVLLASQHPQGVSYGLNEGACYRGVAVRFEDFSSTFSLVRRDQILGSITLNLPGSQNVQNAVGVAAIALELGVSFSVIQESLREFRGASRRFEVKFKSADYMVVDDYAHHPTEIQATLAAAKAGGWKRVIALFQPHRYSRTKHLLKEFGTAFRDADVVMLTDVYAASEAPIEGVDGARLAETVRAAGQDAVIYEASLTRLQRAASREIKAGDLVLTLGAGDIHQVADSLAQEFRWFDMLQRQLSPEAKLLRQEPMSKHTTLRVGGPAQFWCEPANEADLQVALRHAAAEGVPVTVIGRGSNLLVRDGGIVGLCLYLGHKNFSQMRYSGTDIIAGVGARLKTVVMEARKQGLGGLSFLEGIPGNVGGALRMNAGAMQGWMMDVVSEVRVCDFAGNITAVRAESLEINYRHVPYFDTHIALEATLKAKTMTVPEIDEELKLYSKKRWTSQPAAPSAGCIFKNPAVETPAGKLIDQLGLKNMAVGKARVSEVHGNFIVNEGGASAAEVFILMRQIQQAVRDQRGIELEPEVMILGEDS
jgi:UDP-N-acetylmuramate--alanine ligase